MMDIVDDINQYIEYNNLGPASKLRRSLENCKYEIEDLRETVVDMNEADLQATLRHAEEIRRLRAELRTLKNAIQGEADALEIE